MSDDRLFVEMAAVLKAYDAKKVTFRGLLNRLEECADHLAGDAKWQEDFRRLWGRMEVDYAYAAAMGWKQIPEERMPEVLSALSELRTMVATKISELRSDVDES